MESLGDILKRITARNTLKNINGDGAGFRGSATGAVEAPPCPRCHGSGWVRHRVPVGHPDFGQAFPCACQQTQRPEQRQAALRRYSNLGALARLTFSALQTDGPLPDAESQRLFRAGLAAALEFAEAPEGWLTFVGPSGCGKTQLAAAIANRCIERSHTVFFIVVADLLDHLRSAYSPDSPVAYDELFEQVRNVPLLVLDDLTAHSATPWAQEKLLQVFTHRFNNRLPTVITIRGPLQRLDEGIRTRIESATGFSRLLPLAQYNTQLARRIGDLPAEMRQRMTFASFDTRGGVGASAGEQETLAEAKKSAEAFVAKNSSWILFSGTPGCGKTHLAVAIAGEALKQGKPVFFAFVPALLDHLRATFSPDSLIGYDELFEQIKTVPLLVLDDLGAESSTPWAEEKLYQIVALRHEARLPTVITTTYKVGDLEQFKPRLAARLVDEVVVEWVTMAAPNYRGPRRSAEALPPASPPPPRTPRRARLDGQN